MTDYEDILKQCGFKKTNIQRASAPAKDLQIFPVESLSVIVNGVARSYPLSEVIALQSGDGLRMNIDMGEWGVKFDFEVTRKPEPPKA